MSDYIKIAKQVIDIEIEGLDATKSILNDNFIRLIDDIIALKGRVILSGMGKSGHIAHKIAATLSSTGTASFFIHPGEASHGDMGMITKGDLVILLSNSGETKELVDIINYCKRLGIKLVALVRRKTSLLVDTADIAVVLPEVEEASEVDAPTTSTTMMLAFGDALAVTLAEAKGFSKEEFSIYHPGGKLGSQFLKIDKVMRKGNHLPLMVEDSKMSDVIVEMTKKSMGCVGIIEKTSGDLVGVITDGDLRRHMSNDLLNITASEIISGNPKTISGNSLAVEAVNIMTQFKITTIFVVENKKPIGAIHIHDCFKIGLI